MSCKRCNKKQCRCKDYDLGVIKEPCLPPNCIPKKKCGKTTDWNCVVVGNGGITLTNGNDSIFVPPGTSLDSLFQQWQLLLTNPNCILPGNACYSVKWFDVYFDGTRIVVQWDKIDTTALPSGFSLDTYEIEVNHINLNVNYTFIAGDTDIFYITPVGSMSFAPGNMYAIKVKVKTTNGIITLTCDSIIKQITTN